MNVHKELWENEGDILILVSEVGKIFLETYYLEECLWKVVKNYSVEKKVGKNLAIQV